MDNFQSSSSGQAMLKNDYDSGMQKDAMSAALKQRLLNKANKRRLTPAANAPDDAQPLPDEE